MFIANATPQCKGTGGKHLRLRLVFLFVAGRNISEVAPTKTSAQEESSNPHDPRITTISNDRDLFPQPRVR